MSRIDRMLVAAHSAALCGSGVGGTKRNMYRLGAAVFDGPTLLAAKPNSYKTHPKLLRSTQHPVLHAEMATLFAHGTDNCHGCTMMVCRILKNGSFAMAKPCDACMDEIIRAGVKKIFYTTGSGIEHMKL